jgi:toxin-antitoxin system PIN domain toxin
VLLDANILIYAVDRRAERHHAAAAWLTEQLNGPRRVGLPWQTLNAVLRIVTHPRASARPLDARTAWGLVASWLEAPAAWIPHPGHDYARILGQLITTHDLRGNLIPDAALAALAIEHGVPLISNDTDFARFPDLRWEDPLR